ARELEHFGPVLTGGGAHHLAVALPDLLEPQHGISRGAVRRADAPEDEAIERVPREAEVLRRRECRARERSVELAVVLHAVLLDGALAPDAAGAVGLLQRRAHLGHARLAGRRGLRRALLRGRGGLRDRRLNPLLGGGRRGRLGARLGDLDPLAG